MSRQAGRFFYNNMRRRTQKCDAEASKSDRSSGGATSNETSFSDMRRRRQKKQSSVEGAFSRDIGDECSKNGWAFMYVLLGEWGRIDSMVPVVDPKWEYRVFETDLFCGSKDLVVYRRHRSRLQ